VADSVTKSDERIPVTLLTGFLGSGKTTVLNHLVCQPGFARTLVIVNEFGEVGLDHLLVSRLADDTLVEMSSGCLCCTLRGDLIAALKNATWRFTRGGERQFDRVIIETTGLADPVPIMHTLMTLGVLTRHYRLDGVVTTLDMACGGRTLDAHCEALKQVAVADRLLLTKTDLADAATIAALERRLLAINPAAQSICVQHGVVTPAAVLGLGVFNPAEKTPDVARWLAADAYLSTAGNVSPVTWDAHGHAHEQDPGHGHPHPLGQVPELAGPGDPVHDHDPNRHDDRIRAFCLVIEPPLDDSLLDAWLDLLRSLSGPDMLRIKGIINLRGRAAPVVIQGVQHLFHPPVELPAWPDDDRRSKIVFITRDIARQTIDEPLGALMKVWQETVAVPDSSCPATSGDPQCVPT
jgi:G3E family GTPase